MFSLFLFAVLFGLCTVGNASVFCFPSCSFRCFLIFFKPKLILIVYLFVFVCLALLLCYFVFLWFVCFALLCAFCFLFLF